MDLAAWDSDEDMFDYKFFDGQIIDSCQSTTWKSLTVNQTLDEMVLLKQSDDATSSQFWSCQYPKSKCAPKDDVLK